MRKDYIGKICPYCKTPLTESDLVAVCSICDMPHHLSCWQDNHGCTTFGCTGQAKEIVENEDQEVAAPMAEFNARTEEVEQERPAAIKQSVAAPVETLYESQEMLFLSGVPLVQESVELVIDRTKDKLFAKCVFRSITEQKIKAVLIEIVCRDVWGSALGEPVVFQYLDLETKRDSQFGQSSFIELPNKITRNIQVTVKKVLFADNSVVTGEGVAFTMPAPVWLSQQMGDEALAAQYARDTTLQAQFVLTEGAHYWFCTCGALNTNEEAICHRCASQKAQLKAALDLDQLQTNLRTFVEEKEAAAAAAQAEQAERIRQAEEEVRLERERKEREIRMAEYANRKKKRLKKALIISLVSVVLIAAITCGTIFFGIPYYHYHNACVALDNEQYDVAYQGFVNLNGFLDSAELANKTLYSKATVALKNKQYDVAIQTFTELGNYKDSEDQLLEAKYQKAENCLEKEQFKDAYQLFVRLKNYKESKSRVLATIICWEAKALGSSTTNAAQEFERFVILEPEHYQLFYTTILLFLEAHEESEFWYDCENYEGATAASENAYTMLQMLPDAYEDTGTLRKLFNILTSSSWAGEKLFHENAALVRKCWSLAFVQDLAIQDANILDFLEGYWSGSGYYFKFYDKGNCEGIWSQFDLPSSSKPKGTKYYDIRSGIYMWIDKDHEELKKVFRFEFVGYDTIKVYCYYNGRTYTLYRD